MVTEIELFECAYLNPLSFCLRGWMKSEVYKGRVGKCNEFDAGIFEHLL